MKLTGGFTIIEMAITITVVALLMALAMPSVSTWMTNARIRSLAESINSGLQQARNEAVRRNSSVSFWMVDATTSMTDACALSTATGSWVISVNSPAGHCGATPSTTDEPMLVTSYAAGDVVSGGIAIAVTPGGANQTTFNGFGRITNAGAITRIDVTGPAGTRSLRIELTAGGATRMCDPNVNDVKDPRHCTTS